MRTLMAHLKDNANKISYCQNLNCLFCYQFARK